MVLILQLQTGWFSSHVLAAIRRRVEVRFLSVFPGTGAQKLLKNASESFEKLKRICIYKDTLKSDQEENLQINKGLNFLLLSIIFTFQEVYLFAMLLYSSYYCQMVTSIVKVFWSLLFKLS